MKKFYGLSCLLFLIVLSNLVFSQQGLTYYSLLSPVSQTFVSDLKTRIRSPYKLVSYDQYDETNIAYFASRDTSGGKKVVTCVYSRENYVYDGLFKWGYFSREHTWCHSWMPTYPSEAGEEYSDQYHLFPVNQNDANGRRSNHPLGNVANVQFKYGEGKLGTNLKGELVYEPSDIHKGDAARALLYMAVKYDGVKGTWTFNSLNKRLVDSLREAPQDLSTLLEWHRQDPPDKWEVDRNNYIESIQLNRNPFVDHPEYVNYINFNDLSYTLPDLAKEPANQITQLAGSSTDSTITLSWTDALPGSQVPSGYLIIAYDRNNYFIPIDGSAYSDDIDLSDGKARVNIAYSDADSYTFKKLKKAADYYFTVYAYYGTGTKINYNTNDLNIRKTVRTSGALPTKVFFSTETANVAESAGTYMLNVSISNPDSLKAVTVQLALTSGSASDVDNFQTQSLTFPAGSTQTKTVPVNITDDTIAEGDETLTFTLQNVSGGNETSVGIPSSFKLVIKDNDNGQSAGGTENFANYPEKSQTYNTGTFKGQDGSVWTYSSCSGDKQISAPSPLLKKGASPLAKIESGIISGGCGTVSFNYMQAFSTNVNLGLYVNNKLITSVTTNNEPGIVKSSGPVEVNVPGDFTIKFEQINSSSAQVTIDDVSWTPYLINTSTGSNLNYLPAESSLSQNYPNPFNPETTITYSLSKSSFAALKVFDMMGREVATLVNEDKPAGVYTVKFNGSSLSSGIYVCKLVAGDKTFTKKLSLLK